MAASVNREASAASPRKWATTTFVSSRTLPVALIDVFAPVLYGFVESVGLLLREASRGTREDDLSLFLADPFKALDVVRGLVQLAWRKRPEVFDDSLQMAHATKVH